ncbi:MAG TPA: GNAT family N-acetyltransferase [Burkholderiales bacterium]|nr:GNAT family N-acetyltransferase [Burkholderiales bacterium]
MLTTKFLESIVDVPPRAWNGLCDIAHHPFVAHQWLEALEATGCVGAKTDWRPRHITLWRGNELVAAAPTYIKESSEGDFSRDWAWADALQRTGIPYYPKLIIGIPFTPVTGPRLLIRSGEMASEMISALLDAARALAHEQGCEVLQLLYCLPDEARAARSAEWIPRIDFQYHWHNRQYRDLDHFWERFDSKRRNQLKRERRAPAEQGIAIDTVRKEEIARDPLAWARLIHQLHRSTTDKLVWGRAYLNQAFYERLFAHFTDPLEIVIARRDDRIVAGAFNLATPTHLYGRYWGCLEEHRYLHFNVCFYHSIEECIRRGIQVFEGGAGGEHKLARGFEPVEILSAHAFPNPRLATTLRPHIEQETVERRRALDEWNARSPILKPLR